MLETSFTENYYGWEEASIYLKINTDCDFSFGFFNYLLWLKPYDSLRKFIWHAFQRISTRKLIRVLSY